MTFIVTLLIYAVLFVLSELLRPKPNIENQRPKNLGDFQFPTATEGRVVPLVWGTVRLAGPNVVWYGDLVQQAIIEDVKTGLFSSETLTKGFRYFIGIQFGLCRGVIDNVRGIWIGEERVFTGAQAAGVIAINEPDLFGGDDLGQGGVVGDFRVFVGTEVQAASTYLSAFQAEGGDTPAYVGTAYGVFEQGNIGNSTTIKPWKFEVRRIPDNAGALSADQLVNGADANPMAVIYELMTDTDWGLGFPSSDIDLTNFQTTATTLKSEGNGFSFQLESPLEASELLREIERQIDGIVFLNQQTGQWQVKLARNDYVIGNLREVNEGNIVDLINFTRGAWSDTTNQVRLQFVDPQLDFKETFALAQDMANVRIQGGVNVSVTENYPGIKNATLANSVAWRDLRTLTYPLAKATFVMDRSFWDVTPGEVLRWNDTELGIANLPMRVSRIDLGELEDNKVKLDVVQDIFQFSAGVFGDPIPTEWTPPVDTLVAFPSAQQLAFESPRGFISRDTLKFDGTYPVRAWCAGRRQGNEVRFEIRQRNASGVPTGSYFAAGTIVGFMKIGELAAALGPGSAFPFDLTVTPSPDTQAAIQGSFVAADIADAGTNLLGLILVGEEFMLVTGGAVDNASDVDLQDVYRSVLDSVHGDHADATDVYLVFLGGGHSTTVFTNGNNVDIKLVPSSLSDEVAEGTTTTIQFTADSRTSRPYPPSELDLNTVRFPTTTALEGGAGSGLDNENIDVLMNRRDFRTGNGLDEIEALEIDAATLFSDYPGANTSEHQIDVRDDPDGANTFLFSTSWQNSQTIVLPRETILHFTDGVLPTRLRVVVRARHTFNAVVLQSRQELTFDFDVTTALTGNFNFGALDTNDVSNLYTADAAGQHDFTIGTAMPSTGDVEYQLNGGGWLQLIAQGGTTGNIAGVVVSDTIEIRHASTDSNVETEIEMLAPGAGTDAYGVLFT